MSQKVRAPVGQPPQPMSWQKRFMHAPPRQMKPFMQALGLSTSFRNEEAAKILMAEVDPLVQKTLAELPKTIAAIDGAADQLQRTFAKVEGLSPNADAALVAARDTLRSAGGVVAADSPLLYRLDRTLDDLSAAAEAIRHFAEDLERNPGILVRGRAASKEEGR